MPKRITVRCPGPNNVCWRLDERWTQCKNAISKWNGFGYYYVPFILVRRIYREQSMRDRCAVSKCDCFMAARCLCTLTPTYFHNAPPSTNFASINSQIDRKSQRALMNQWYMPRCRSWQESKTRHWRIARVFFFCFGFYCLAGYHPVHSSFILIASRDKRTMKSSGAKHVLNAINVIQL